MVDYLFAIRMKWNFFSLKNFKRVWRRRARKNLIKAVGEKDWCIFVKSLCSSWSSCSGFPFDCKCCFDGYFNPDEFLQHVLGN